MTSTHRFTRKAATAALILAGLLFASVAMADEPADDGAQVWGNDVMHFSYGPDVAIETRTVSAPDGDVEIITARLLDTEAGTALGRSWVAFTLYRAPVALDGADAASPSQVLEYTLAHNRAATGGATQVEGADVQLGNDVLDGVRVTFDGVPGVHAAAVATAFEGTTVVAWYHRDPADAPRFDDLNDVMATFGTGPAPEPSGDEASEGDAPTEGDEAAE